MWVQEGNPPGPPCNRYAAVIPVQKHIGLYLRGDPKALVIRSLAEFGGTQREEFRFEEFWTERYAASVTTTVDEAICQMGKTRSLVVASRLAASSCWTAEKAVKTRDPFGWDTIVKAAERVLRNMLGLVSVKDMVLVANPDTAIPYGRECDGVVVLPAAIEGIPLVIEPAAAGGYAIPTGDALLLTALPGAKPGPILSTVSIFCLESGTEFQAGNQRMLLDDFDCRMTCPESGVYIAGNPRG